MKLLQEKYKRHPWKMMICCILLNQTNNKQVSKVMDEFFKRWPTSHKATKAVWHEMTKVIKPLGLYNRRTKTIVEFSKQYRSGNWIKIKDSYGIGQYGQDSWDIFIENKLDINPEDKKLKAYLNNL